MLLGGLWHGAANTFIVWGALHGAGLAVTRWYQRRFPTAEVAEPQTWRIWLNRILTFHFVCLAWIFFRSPDVATATEMLRTIGAGTLGLNLGNMPVLLVMAGMLMHFGHGPWKDWLVKRFVALPPVVQAFIAFIIVCIVALANRVAAPFIYFQF